MNCGLDFNVFVQPKKYISKRLIRGAVVDCSEFEWAWRKCTDGYQWYNASYDLPLQVNYASGFPVVISEARPVENSTSSAAAAGDEAQAPLVVIFSHGNAQDVSDVTVKRVCQHIATKLHARVYAYEYPTYVQTDKCVRPEELESTMAHHSRVVAELIRDRFFRSNASKCADTSGSRAVRFNCVGFSLGCFMALHMARFLAETLECRDKRLEVECTLFAPFASCLSTAIPPELATRLFKRADMFSNKALIELMSSVVTINIVHGKEDDVVPISNSRYLHKRSNGKVNLIEVPGLDHNDIVYMQNGQFIANTLKERVHSQRTTDQMSQQALQEQQAPQEQQPQQAQPQPQQV